MGQHQSDDVGRCVQHRRHAMWTLTEILLKGLFMALIEQPYVRSKIRTDLSKPTLAGVPAGVDY